jgi:uncharacterized membrane protein
MYRYGYYMIPRAQVPAFLIPFWGFLNLTFWVLLILLVIGLLVDVFDKKLPKDENEKGSDPDSLHSGSRGSALEALKKRYAEGDIDKEKFLEMKKDIS